MTFSDKTAITGIGETDFVKGAERTAVDMMLEAARKAIADAGLKPADIDGMVPPPIYTTSEELAANLGIDVLRYAATVHMGGASPTTALQNAAMAISAGLCDHVLVTLGWNGFSALRPKPGAPRTRSMNMNTLTNTIQGYYIPYGVFLPVQMYAWLAMRHSQLYGVGPEATAAIALACRKHAQLNPKAFTYGKPLDRETYHAARWISEPFRLYDCCLETDGACAVVVSRLDRARDLRHVPVTIAGAAEGHPYPADDIPSRHDPFKIGLSYAAPKAFEMAGVTREDMDFLQIYDCFTITALMTLEDYGFCKPGQGGSFVASGAIDADGELPINTSGGLLSETGMPGLQLVIEGVRQLRGEAANQVSGARLCAVSNQGGVMHTHSTLILGQ